MSRNIENSLLNVAENIQNHMNETNSQVFVYVGKKKMQIVNEFAIMFGTAFLQCIDDYNLTRNDIRIMLKIIEYMQFGNLVKLSYSSIAKDLNIDKSNVSKTIKKLKENKLIITDKDNDYLNPHVIAKGKFIDDIGEHLLEKAAEELEGSNINPSILTPSLRRKNKQLWFLQNFNFFGNLGKKIKEIKAEDIIMGWRFRKSLKLLPGIKVNIGKKTTSLTVGGMGCSLNIGPNGKKLTLGMPGTGISYSTFLNKKNNNSNKIQTRQYSSLEWKIFWISIIFMIFCFLFKFE